MTADGDSGAQAGIKLAAAALLLATQHPLPAQAQLDAFIDRLVRPPAPPSYPYYYRPPPTYPAPYYPPAYPQAYPPAYIPAPSRPAASVEEAQRTLGVLGYDAGPIDGVAGPRLSDAIRAFQRDHGQAADGRLTAQTVAALRAALHEREAAGRPAPEPVARAAQPAAPGAAAVPLEGKYCVFWPGSAYDMLLVRDSGASLQFGLSSWLQNGHNFAVAGAATLAGSGWHFESGMASRDPDDHCKIDIARLPNGGFRFATEEGARCVSSGGNGAAPQAPMVFAAATRTGNPPQTVTGETLMQIGCDRRQDVAARAAPPAGLLFQGSAQAGQQARTVQFRFRCLSQPKTGGGDLSLDVDIPDSARLQGTIDLSGMEGPYPQPAPPHVTLHVEHDSGADSVEAGFYGNGSSVAQDMMAIGLHEEKAGPRRAKLLATALASAADGAGTLTWRLDNPEANKPALQATLPLSAADAAALRQSLRACLPAP